ncbi:MAG TPA: hypothetical protein DIT04_12795 [Dysgonomonas sp.]|nr:hypothetical protein [Dysgonomonas sp.]
MIRILISKSTKKLLRNHFVNIHYDLINKHAKEWFWSLLYYKISEQLSYRIKYLPLQAEIKIIKIK